MKFIRFAITGEFVPVCGSSTDAIEKPMTIEICSPAIWSMAKTIFSKSPAQSPSNASLKISMTKKFIARS